MRERIMTADISIANCKPPKYTPVVNLLRTEYISLFDVSLFFVERFTCAKNANMPYKETTVFECNFAFSLNIESLT